MKKRGTRDKASCSLSRLVRLCFIDGWSELRGPWEYKNKFELIFWLIRYWGLTMSRAWETPIMFWWCYKYWPNSTCNGKLNLTRQLLVSFKMRQRRATVDARARPCPLCPLKSSIIVEIYTLLPLKKGSKKLLIWRFITVTITREQSREGKRVGRSRSSSHH